MVSSVNDARTCNLIGCLKPLVQNFVNLHKLRQHRMNFKHPTGMLMMFFFYIFHGGPGVSIYSRRKDKTLFIRYRLVFLGCLSRSVEIVIVPSSATKVGPVKLGKQ